MVGAIRMTARKEIVLDIETRNTFQDVGAYNPALLKVSLVGVYFYDTDTYESFLEEDLPKLWPRLERTDRIVGYNLKGFDMPCLQSYYTGEIMKLPMLDIMYEISDRIGFRVKLDDVAQATLGVGKTGHGLQAVEFWKNGELDKLRDYCLQDVKITRDVYEHALATGEIKYNDRTGAPQTVSLPLELPRASEQKAINLSLGL